MTLYTIYRPESGEIVRTGSCPEKLVSMQVREGEAVLREKSSDVEHYVVDGKIQNRPELNIQESGGHLTNTIITFSNVPLGCEVRHPGGFDTVSDGAVEWETPEPGKYSFVFNLFPYKTKEFVIEITT